MQWIKYSNAAFPPQGLKVLCFKDGDCWVAYSFQNGDKRIWIPAVPSTPEVRKIKMLQCDAPDYWCYIPFSNVPTERKYEGLIKLFCEASNELLTVDEFSMDYPEEYAKFIEFIVEMTDGV